MTVLLVEDEDTIREVEKAYLKRAGYQVSEAADGVTALQIFKDISPDLLVLDLNLPGIDGIQVCKKIRETSNIPIIMVTARVEEIDEISGLEIGADDYVKKPFSPSILVARVQALLRRTIGNTIEIDNLVINPEKMTVQLNGEKLSLTTTQFNILYLLANQPGRVFTRYEILDRAYDDTLPNDVLDRTIDAHIKSIRKALGDKSKKPKYVLTVIGRGYKFNDEL